MELLDFEWKRCLDGYELVEHSEIGKWPRNVIVKIVGGPKLRVQGTIIQSKSQRFERYRPANDLFATFMAASHTPEGMLAFSNKFGLLHSTSRTYPVPLPTSEAELIDQSLAHHSAMRSASLCFKRRDMAELVRRYNSYGLSASLRLQQNTDGVIRIVLVPTSLSYAMWLQFALHAGSGAQLLECERCGKPFAVGTNTGRRNTSKYCSNACKIAAFKKRHGQH